MMAVSRDAAVGVVASLPWYIRVKYDPDSSRCGAVCFQTNLLFDLAVLGNCDCRGESFANFFGFTMAFSWCRAAVVFACSRNVRTAVVGPGRLDISVSLMISIVITTVSV